MQRLLLDTHAFLWWVSEVDRLKPGARAAIADPRNEVFISAVTGWEIAVKKAKDHHSRVCRSSDDAGRKQQTHVRATVPVLEKGMVVPADDIRRPFVILGKAEHLFRAGKLQEGRGMSCHQYLRIVDGNK